MSVSSLSVETGEVDEWADFRGIPVGVDGVGLSFWRVDREAMVFHGGVMDGFKFSFSVEQDRSARLRLGFRRTWRALEERFYDKTKVKKPMAHPGMVFKASWDGPLVVARVIAGTPVSRVKGAPVAGDTVLRIGGKEVDAKTDLGRFFNGAEGDSLPMVVAGADGKKRTMALMSVDYDEVRLIDREAKTAAAARMAEQKDFTYLPFRKMKTDDLRDLAVEIYRASLDSDGLILDMRDNQGGRVADELLGLFCQAFKRLGRGKLVGEQTNGGVISTVSVEIPEIGELQVPFRGWFDVDTGRDLELNGAVPDVVVSLGPGDQAEGNDPQLAAAIAILSKEIFDKSPRVKARIKSEREEK